MKKLLALLIVVCLVLVPTATGVFGGGEPAPAAKDWKDIYVLKQLPKKNEDDKLRQLLVERYNMIAVEMKSVIALKHEAEPHPWYDEAIVDVSRRIYRTVLDFEDPRERAGLLTDVLGQVKILEQKFEALEKTVKDTRTKIQLSRFRSLRLEMEYHIARSEKK